MLLPVTTSTTGPPGTSTSSSAARAAAADPSTRSPAAAKAPTPRAMARSETCTKGVPSLTSSSTASGTATRTASPSAKVLMRSQETGRPAATLSAMTGALFETTPTEPGSPRATPISSAPFPTGTSVSAGLSPSCPRISRPIAV
jgi:hypothetical protein